MNMLKIRRNINFAIGISVNAILLCALMLSYEGTLADGDRPGPEILDRDASIDVLVLPARIVRRIHDDSVASMFHKAAQHDVGADATQSPRNGSEPIRLLGIINSERPSETRIAIVEMGDGHQIVRLREGLNADHPDLHVLKIGTRSLDLKLGSELVVLNLN